jgi:sugar/nucleoside kinase (ribokinase family)
MRTTAPRLSMRVLIVGDIAWDILIRPDEEIVWGSDVFGAVRLMPGGSAANVAVWARRLGADVMLRGKIGDDPLGILMRAHLTTESVARGLIVSPGAATTRVGVLVSIRGERAFVTDRETELPFQNGELSPADLGGAELLFLNGYSVFASRSIDPIRALLAAARAKNVPIAFDPSSFELVRAYGAARLLDEIGHVQILLVNEEEAAALQPADGLRGLLRYADLLVVKRGPAGATALSNDGEESADVEPVAVRDTTGAGDAFDAAFLVEFHRHGSVARALKTANRLGAHVASQLGAQPPAPVPSGA